MPVELLFRWGCTYCKKPFEDEQNAAICELAHEERMKNVQITGFNFPKKKLGFSQSVHDSGIAPDRIFVKFSDNPGDHASYVLASYGPKAV